MDSEIPEKISIDLFDELSKSHTSLKEHYQVLAEREALFKATLENMSDAVVITDDDGKFTFVCPNTATIFGLSTEEVLLLGSIDELLQAPVCKIDLLKAEREIRNIKHRFVDIFGKLHFLLITAKSVDMGSGTALYVIRDISDLKDIQIALQQKENELSEKNKKLEKLNIALEVVIERKNEQLGNLRSEIINQYNSFVKPHLEGFKNISHNQQDAQYLLLIEQGIKHIFSPFVQQIMSPNYHFSPMEIKVASLITSGMTIKEMAIGLGVSHHTIKYHRKNIRSKLGLKNQKINLCSYLTGGSFGLKE